MSDEKSGTACRRVSKNRHEMLPVGILKLKPAAYNFRTQDDGTLVFQLSRYKMEKEWCGGPRKMRKT